LKTTVIKTLLTVTCAAIFAVSSFAQAGSEKLIGKWKGSLKMTMPKAQNGVGMSAPPASTLPQFTIEFAKNGTYKSTQDAPGRPVVKSEGKWTLKKNAVTMTTTTRDGKKVTGEMAKPRVLILEASGKVITFDVTRFATPSASRPAGQGGPGAGGNRPGGGGPGMPPGMKVTLSYSKVG